MPPLDLPLDLIHHIGFWTLFSIALGALILVSRLCRRLHSLKDWQTKYEEHSSKLEVSAAKIHSDLAEVRRRTSYILNGLEGE